MDKCNHFWVDRKDGYEEQCSAAICIICGEYGCYCVLKREKENMSDSLWERRLTLFDELGIDGNGHEIEKSLNANKTE